MIQASFWCGKRVFLTGHTGFKGAWASLLLARLGARVTGFSLAPELSPNLFDLTGAVETLDAHIIADIRHSRELASAMQAAKPHIVLHMAAQSLVRRSYANPAETFSVNVMGTANVLDAVRATPGIEAAIIVTTDKVYDLSTDVSPRKETDPLGGHDPYSASKAAAEIVAASWRESFFAAGCPRIATVRSGNVIGGGDWSPDRIVSDIVTAVRAGHDIELRYPDSVRPWLFVLDTLTGYLMLAERLVHEGDTFSQAWNFGPQLGEELRVKDLVTVFGRAWGTDLQWWQAEGAHPPEANILRLDPSKAMQKLGWRPSMSQADAISETAGWYRDFLTAHETPADLCTAAIVRHLSRIGAS